MVTSGERNGLSVIECKERQNDDDDDDDDDGLNLHP